MRIVVLFFEKVDVVRGNDADVQLFPELQHAFDDLDLARIKVREPLAHAHRHVRARLPGRMQHHFQRIIVAEQILVPARNALGFRKVAGVQRMRDFSGDAGGGTMQPFVVFLQQGVVYARMVVEPLGMGD